MAFKTLLEMTQDILSSMDSDEVNSITDSVEALQVATLIRETYFNIIDGKDWPWLNELFQLTASTDAAKPTHMQLPSNIIDLQLVKYNTRTSTDTFDKFLKIAYKTPEEFLIISANRNSSLSNILVVTDFGGSSINVFTDKAPQYYTSFDDNYIVFDSYDSSVDTTLQTVKTQCFGKRYPTFTMSDSFIADMPVQMFSYFYNEAKAVCFADLKQATNRKAEQNSISQRRRMSQQAWKVAGGITYPDYGRKK